MSEEDELIHYRLPAIDYSKVNNLDWLNFHIDDVRRTKSIGKDCFIYEYWYDSIFKDVFFQDRTKSDYYLWPQPFQKKYEVYQWIREGNARYCISVNLKQIDDYLILKTADSAFKKSHMIPPNLVLQEKEVDMISRVKGLCLTEEEWIDSSISVLAFTPFTETEFFIVIEEDRIKCRRCKDGSEVAVPRNIMKKYNG